MATNTSIGHVALGGMVTIQYPNARIEMSCDNQHELEQVVDILRKMLELWETDHAKKLIANATSNSTGSNRLSKNKNSITNTSVVSS